MGKIQCQERYKGFQHKEAEERKAWLESHGFNVVLSYNSFWAFPYVLKWETNENDLQ